MVNRRLMDFFEGTDRFDNRQYTFLCGRSMITYFASLGQILSNASSVKNYVELVSLNIAKPYNRTWIPDSLKEPKLWSIPGNLPIYQKRVVFPSTARSTHIEKCESVDQSSPAISHSRHPFPGGHGGTSCQTPEVIPPATRW